MKTSTQKPAVLMKILIILKKIVMKKAAQTKRTHNKTSITKYKIRKRTQSNLLKQFWRKNHRNLKKLMKKIN